MVATSHSETKAKPFKTSEGRVTAIHSSPPHVLLIDDDPIHLEIVSVLLRAEHVEAVTALSGQEALSILEKVPAGIAVLVFMDIHMPGLSGPDLLLRLRQLRPSVRILGMSASTPNEGALALLDGFMLKPLGPAALRKVLRGGQARQPATSAVPATGVQPVLVETTYKRFVHMLPQAALQSLYNAYFFDASQRLTALKAAAKSRDRDAFRMAAHALKGSSAMLGFALIAQKASALEQQMLSEGKMPTIISLDALMRDVEAAHALLSSRLNSISDLNQAPTHTASGTR
jgi:CheY-like chemotaxis protein